MPTPAARTLGRPTIMNQDGLTRSIWNISGTFTIDAAFASTDPFIQAVTGPGTGSTYNFLPDWTGSWTHGTMSGDEWRTYVTTHPEFKLDGTSITTGMFDAGFRVTNSGRTLSLRPPGTGAPTLLPEDFHDNRGGGSVAEGTLVTYTVTFSKDMNAATVEASEFANADWNPGADAADTANRGVRFARFVSTVDAGLAALEAAGWDPRIKGMLWHQGEADSVDPAAANAYGANLSHFVARIREQFAPYASPDGTRFVAGQPSETSSYPYRDTVRQAILNADEDSGAPLSVANTSIVATNVVDFPNRTDNVHLNWVGTLAMGRAMAYRMLDLDATTYADWALAHGLVGGFDDDDDADGLSNGLEFAFGGNPRDGSDKPGPVGDSVEIEGTQYPVWVVQRDLGAAHVVMNAYFSTDLLDWESKVPELDSCVRGTNGIAVLTFRSPFAPGTGTAAKGFFRLRVTSE